MTTPTQRGVFASIKITVITAMLASSQIACAYNATALLNVIGGATSKKSNFEPGTTYSLCFVPDGPSCEELIVNSIGKLKGSLLIQAYSFTSPGIAQAVVRAHKRGVDVRVIVDKSQISEKYTAATFLKNEGISVWVDSTPAIAHSKVMILDQEAIFTGSFNFTRSAQERNAENGIVIQGDVGVVKAYTENWQKRLRVSSPF